MPTNPADRHVTAAMSRRRGMKRLSAVTAGVGVASVLATGAIAVALPGATHGSTKTSTANSGSAATGSASTGASSTNSSGSRSGSSSTSSSGQADATSGGS